MIGLIILLLIILWLLGYIHIAGLTVADFPLFAINNHTITLWELLIFFLIVWAVGILPSPLRQIAFVILVLWLLSTLGIFAIAGLSSILVIAIIVGLILSVLGIV
jgi:hypothetical protein